MMTFGSLVSEMTFYGGVRGNVVWDSMWDLVGCGMTELDFVGGNCEEYSCRDAAKVAFEDFLDKIKCHFLKAEVYVMDGRYLIWAKYGGIESGDMCIDSYKQN